MKNIYLILGVFTMLFSACETDFDVNAEWEETTVVFGLLDASDENQLQKIKISKAFLGNMDAYQMAQYSDSINYGVDELDVKIYKWNYNQIEDSVELIPMPTYRDGEIFYDSIIVYQFYNLNSFLQKGYEYELVVKNNKSGNIVTSRTEIVTGFDFDFLFQNSSSSSITSTSATVGAGGSVGSSVYVEDIRTGDGTTATFTLSTAAPYEESILVFIDGVGQPTSSFTLPSTTIVS